MQTRVTQLLDKAGITYKLKPHKRPVYTSQEAAAERGVRLSQIVKTMLLKLPDGQVIVTLLPGNRQLDLKRVRKLVGVRKLSFVKREEVENLTGYIPGAISPLGMNHAYPLYLDETVLKEEWVDISSGEPDAGVELRSADLLRLVQATVATFSKPPAESD